MKPFSLFAFAAAALVSLSAQAQPLPNSLDSLVPVRALCIDAPRPSGVDSFVHFIDADLGPKKINTLVLAVEYRYQFTSHPELIDSFALSRADVNRIAEACRRNRIRVIPHINLLGHQSWASRPGKLLAAYPQFDETPWVAFPAKYDWPNADSLYCKSYCPLHPGVHKIVFDVVDEICDAFGADAFHAGMDEVFYLGMDKCPRCHGKDRSVLFADEVKRIHDHLAAKHREMWLWSDRFLDGRTTGIGEWEASFNDTWRAIDLVPKDIVMCDWHYERADKTPVYFAAKGFRVLSCPWRTPEFAVQQIRDVVDFRRESTPEMRARILCVMETTWTSAANFLTGYYTQPAGEDQPAWKTFRVICDTLQKL